MKSEVLLWCLSLVSCAKNEEKLRKRKEKSQREFIRPRITKEPTDKIAKWDETSKLCLRFKKFSKLKKLGFYVRSGKSACKSHAPIVEQARECTCKSRSPNGDFEKNLKMAIFLNGGIPKNIDFKKCRFSEIIDF